MIPSRWRFLDTGARPGSLNMALDEQLARRLVEEPPDLRSNDLLPVLRLFRWSPWAISLGYNQELTEIDIGACTRDGIDIVRRPTGGRAILHAEELTYSVVMIAGRKSILQLYNDISRALVRGLWMFGVNATVQRSQPNFGEAYRRPSSIPCFTSSARYEIEWGGRKLVGSAQRRFSGETGDVVLQHGSILCGPAHQDLARYLLLEAGDLREQIQTDLRERTIDLSAILQRRVDEGELAACIRRGFELEWSITFTEAN
jgi:lipoate-protein ligase A